MYGESLKSALVGLVVPDSETLLPWAKGQPHLLNKSFLELCSEPSVKKFIYDGIVRAAREGSLHNFEIPKVIALIPEPMTVENGLLTATFKAKRYEFLSSVLR